MSSSSPISIAHHIPTTLFIIITVFTASLINTTHPTPYIDEIFHIPQAKAFCSALFPLSPSLRAIWHRFKAVQYDEKLTTPPGLYAISLGLAKVLPGWGCADVIWLRGTNLVLLLTLPVLVSQILRQNQEKNCSPTWSLFTPSQIRKLKFKRNTAVSRREIESLQQKARQEAPPTPDVAYNFEPDLNSLAIPTTSIITHAPQLSPRPNISLASKPKRSEPSAYVTAMACTICLLPPLWFFGFLYYTDIASVWLVLACLGLYNRLNNPSPRLGTALMITVTSVLAVFVRQTNLVWVLFCAAQAVLSHLPTSESKGLIPEVTGSFQTAFGKDKRVEFWKFILKCFAPVMPMLIGCIAFMRWNGGSIVLGDKSNHQAGLHFAQLGYFLAFSSFFGLFHLIFSLASQRLGSFAAKSPSSSSSSSSSSILFRTLNTNKQAISVLITTMTGSVYSIAGFVLVLGMFSKAVEGYTIEHPFLLADNRHYTFYLWRMFRTKYTRWAVEPRFIAVPIYSAALFAWGRAVKQTRGYLFGLLLTGAIGATLIPTPLIEFRYYLLPYLMLRIYSQPHEFVSTTSKPVKVNELKQEKRMREEEEIDKEWDAQTSTKWVFLTLELALYALVNLITVGLFVLKPFEWEADAVNKERSEGTIMRFIW
ncbi:related to Alpha-1,2 glucosyltransferase ALG10 [Melanopsichium pennsylvanicum]|uniref:Dol-P-Glc:Glc(2)Man(9)GlcNAc(2)-PP-Dol alpha-1,2-glucosyltransferase n=1 Tax=Melanopsichium pennsylvanicum TaxID=63383 RepID=A0AAJ4XQN1_9BASI|nr:related to Alpha-1,2 glucosyltransferase ALG10 [Melanopsichium pennsylvanicum]